MEVLISIYAVLTFDTVNSVCIDQDKRILPHIHDITYHVHLPICNNLKLYMLVKNF